VKQKLRYSVKQQLFDDRMDSIK